MKTILEPVKEETIIKKSKFICLLYQINKKEDVQNILNEIKDIYKGATHYCYAYKLGQIEKCSDDGEPSKTAGLPILNVLKNEDIDYVLCVVVRYFGGIKLGASGLIHAYKDSVKNCLSKAIKEECTKGLLIKIIFPYQNSKNIDYLLKNNRIIKKIYDENIIYTFECDYYNFDTIKSTLKEFIDNLEIIEEKIIIKKSGYYLS